jgi:hypothetical protein
MAFNPEPPISMASVIGPLPDCMGDEAVAFFSGVVGVDALDVISNEL